VFPLSVKPIGDDISKLLELCLGSWPARNEQEQSRPWLERKWLQYFGRKPTRAYALKRLEEHAELDAVSRRHAEYFTGHLESQREALLPLPQAERVEDHSRQLSDVRAALEWSFGPRGDAEIATRLAVPATQLLLELSLLTECQLWSERAIALLERQHPDSRREMEICATLPFALMYTEGNNQRVRTAFSRALRAAVRQQDVEAEAPERALSIFLLDQRHQQCD
jgi:hypothetical protein